MKDALNSPLLKIIIGFLATLLLAFLVGISGWAWGNITARTQKNEDMSMATKSRVTKLEVEVLNIREGLHRIEYKLDKALERK